MAQEPLACALGRASLPRPAGGSGRLAGAQAGLSIDSLLPHGSTRASPGRPPWARDWTSRTLAWAESRAEPSVSWSRALERSLCYAYGCWEVLEKRRPRPIDLIVGRSMALGSSLFAPVYWPAAPVVNFLDYYYHAHRHDLADEAGPETPPAYFHWRQSMAAIDLLDLEQADLGWTPTEWQRQLYPGRVSRLVPGAARRHRHAPIRMRLPGTPTVRGRGRSPAG